MKTEFSKLLDPISEESFFESYFRNAPLFISQEKDFDHIITTDEISGYFERPSLLYPYLRVVGNGQEVDIKQYRLVEKDDFHVLSKNRVFDLFAQGHTLVIQGAQYQFTNLQKLISNLETELGLEINANIYITPSGSKGFFPHFDLHEVLVLQINGTKIWNVFSELPIEAPIQGSLPRMSREAFTESGTKNTFYLQPGDVLYIPRGVVHEAFCTDFPSIHVTIGFNPKLKIDILRQLVGRLENIAYFREVFSTYKQDFNPASTAKEMADRISNALIELIENEKKYDFEKLKYSKSDQRFEQFFGLDNLDIDELKTLKFELVSINEIEPQMNPLLAHLSEGRSLDDYILSSDTSVADLKTALKSLINQRLIRIIQDE